MKCGEDVCDHVVHAVVVVVVVVVVLAAAAASVVAPHDEYQ